MKKLKLRAVELWDRIVSLPGYTPEQEELVNEFNEIMNKLGIKREDFNKSMLV